MGNYYNLPMRGDKLVIQEHHVKAAQSLLPLLIPKILQSRDTFIITIAGESGSGKSEIAAVLARLLHEEKNMKSIVIQQDDYFVYPPKTNAQMRRKNIRHVGPSEVRLELLEQNLSDILKNHSEIRKPLVIFDKDEITEETLRLEGTRVVIVEGTYTTLLHNVHQHIFIDRTYMETRESRRQRAREEQGQYLETILEIEHRIISSHKPRADIIVTKNYEAERNEQKGNQ
jgi:uridine kinase